MTDGFGSITWWGFSPSVDLRDHDIDSSFWELKLQEQGDDSLNILLVGAGDCRHILKTISRSYKYTRRTINFYVLETSLELYARNVLLLSIALEKPCRLGLQEKTELFLELFGNTLVRKQSMDYVEKMATEYIKMVTDFDYLEKKLPLIDMSMLKFKERDLLEGIFKFWRTADKAAFDIPKSWDLRLRQYLGTRYDAIPNVFDWDYNMKLAERDAGIVNGRTYAQWRTNGVAFSMREGTYDTTNKTLASGMVFKQDGERHARRGYWGDVLVSPYIAYGIECSKKEFFQKSNNIFTYSSEHVSEYNMNSLLYELAHREKYVAPEPAEPESTPKDEQTKQAASLTEITEEEEEEEECAETTINDTPVNEETPADVEESSGLHQEYQALPVDFARVHFLPIGCLPDLCKKSKFNKFFDTAYFSNSLVHLLTPEINQLFSDKCSVILESAKYMLELKPEQYVEFANKVTGLAASAGCKPCSGNDPATSNHLRFTFSRES